MLDFSYLKNIELNLKIGIPIVFIGIINAFFELPNPILITGTLFIILAGYYGITGTNKNTEEIKNITKLFNPQQQPPKTNEEKEINQLTKAEKDYVNSTIERIKKIGEEKK